MTAESNGAIVTLENLAVGYGRQPILNSVNATVTPGDAIGLLGANGSGKTTLLKTVAGILPPLAGKIRFNHDSGSKVVIGYVPQRESLDQVFLLSSLEIVLMGVCGRVGPGRFINHSEREFAHICLERTGGGNLARQLFAELSGGQKQRVMIARALMARPDFLLLDEPTAGVDTAATAALADLLLALNSDGMTLLMVNHDLPVIRRVARRVFWARNGSVEQGETREMLSRDRLEELPVE